MRVFNSIAIVFCGIFILSADSCDSVPASDATQQNQQEAMRKQANDQVGMPGVTNFTEMKMMKMLYELRDQRIATFSYVMDLNGRLHHVCDSIGFGLPYGVQFSNPEKHIWNNSGNYNLPQSEPNGLFMPPTAEGTWIMCAGDKGKIEPIYVEPRVIVTTFKMNAVDSWKQ
jgi:hypothetical protein